MANDNRNEEVLDGSHAMAGSTANTSTIEAQMGGTFVTSSSGEVKRLPEETVTHENVLAIVQKMQHEKNLLLANALRSERQIISLETELKAVKSNADVPAANADVSPAKMSEKIGDDSDTVVPVTKRRRMEKGDALKEMKLAGEVMNLQPIFNDACARFLYATMQAFYSEIPLRKEWVGKNEKVIPEKESGLAVLFFVSTPGKHDKCMRSPPGRASTNIMRKCVIKRIKNLNASENITTKSIEGETAPLLPWLASFGGAKRTKWLVNSLFTMLDKQPKGGITGSPGTKTVRKKGGTTSRIKVVKATHAEGIEDNLPTFKGDTRENQLARAVSIQDLHRAKNRILNGRRNTAKLNLFNQLLWIVRAKYEEKEMRGLDTPDLQVISEDLPRVEGKFFALRMDKFTAAPLSFIAADKEDEAEREAANTELFDKLMEMHPWLVLKLKYKRVVTYDSRDMGTEDPEYKQDGLFREDESTVNLLSLAAGAVCDLFGLEYAQLWEVSRVAMRAVLALAIGIRSAVLEVVKPNYNRTPFERLAQGTSTLLSTKANPVLVSLMFGSVLTKQELLEKDERKRSSRGTSTGRGSSYVTSEAEGEVKAEKWKKYIQQMRTISWNTYKADKNAAEEEENERANRAKHLTYSEEGGSAGGSESEDDAYTRGGIGELPEDVDMWND